MDLASLGIAKIEVFLLVLTRTAGIFTLVPIFGSTQVPVYVRVAIAVSLSLVFVTFCGPSAHGPVANDVMTMFLLVAKEALVGMVIGFVTILVFSAIQAAGDFIDVQSGFSFAQMFDPVYGSQTAVAGRLHHLLAGLIFFISNVHHILIAGMADSFRVVPIGQLTFNPAVSGTAVDLFVTLFAVAVRIAAPVVAAVFMADLALAIISRAVPQMNILMVGMPLKLGVGLVGLLVALPVSFALCRDAMGDMHSQMFSLLRALSAP